MNRCHETHPDPEIRQKYKEWRIAYWNYQSRSIGYSSHEAEMKDKERKDAEKASRTVMSQLRMIGAAVAQNLRNPAAAQKAKKMRRASGRRGA